MHTGYNNPIKISSRVSKKKCPGKLIHNLTAIWVTLNDLNIS